MSAPFGFHAPTRVRFGVGTRADLPEILGAGRWGVVSSPTVLKKTRIRDVLDRGMAGGVTVEHLGVVSPNPRLREVDALLARAHDVRVVGFVAVGGGSVLDAAKLLRVAYRYGVTAGEVLDDLRGVLAAPVVREGRLVAVPTTAGTGAEVSQGAIITDEATGTKRAARGSVLIPDDAVIDPELALSLAARRTAETGFDIVAHAAETFLSRAATPVTDVLALAALQAVPQALIRVMDVPQDIEARTTLALHAWLMGYNLAHASTCLPHRMQYPIGAATDTSHQIGLAALYPAWFRAEATAVPARAGTVAGLIRQGLRFSGTPIEDQAPPEVVMATLLRRLGILIGLRDLGIGDTDVAELAAKVTGRTELDPLAPTPGQILRLFQESLTAFELENR